MSVFKCDIKYKKIEGDSLTSTLNRLKAHKFIIGDRIPKDRLADFIQAREELNQEASQKLGEKVNLFTYNLTPKGMKITPMKDVFKLLDSLTPFKAPNVPKDFKRDIRFYGNQALLSQEEEERELKIRQPESPVNSEIEYAEEYYEETFDPNIEENIITSEGDYIPNYESPVYQDNVEKELQQSQQDLNNTMITILEKDKQMDSKEDEKPVQNKQLEFEFNSIPSIETAWTSNQEKLISKFPEITYEDFVSLSNEERDNLLACL